MHKPRKWAGAGGVVAALSLALAGCQTAAPSIPPSASPATVRTQLVQRLATWKNVSVTLQETSVNGKSTEKRSIQAVNVAGTGAFRAHITSATGPDLLVIGDGSETEAYQYGADTYLVAPVENMNPDAFQMVGPALEGLLKNASHLSTRFPKKNVVELTFQGGTGNFPNTTWTLDYNLTTNAPVSLKETGPGGTVTETVQQFSANPVLPASTLAFQPAPGVTAELAANPDPNQILNSVVPLTFPPLLPPDGANLTLESVEATQRPAPVVVLTSNTQGLGTVIITEFRYSGKGGPGAPKGVKSSAQWWGSIHVTQASLPDGEQYSGFVQGNTVVWIEGTSQAVTNITGAWTQSLTPAVSGSSSPSQTSVSSSAPTPSH